MTHKSKRYWRNKADAEWRRIIHQVGFCEMCLSKDKKLEAHHIIDRRIMEYRCCLTNGVLLCTNCHRFASWIAEKNRDFFHRWLRAERPGVWRWFLRNTVEKQRQVGEKIVKTREPIKHKQKTDFEQIYKELKEIKL